MQRTDQTPLQTLLHSLIWLIGIAAAFPPYVNEWAFMGDSIILRNGPGNFALNILVAAGLTLASGMLWGGIGRWIASTGSKPIAALVILGLTFLCAIGFANPGNPPLIGETTSRFSGANYYAALIGLSAISIVALLIVDRSEKARLPQLWRLFCTSKPFNGFFYALLFIVLVANAGLTIYRAAEFSAGHSWSLFLGRSAVSLTLVCIMFFAVRGTERTAPSWLQWLVWPVAGLIPVIAIADFQILAYWNQSLFPLLNTLTNSGSFDLAHELREAKAPVSAFTIYLGLAFIFVLVGALSIYLWKLSKKHGLKISPLVVSFTALLGVVVSSAEQSLGKRWKSVTAWQSENAYFDIHISPISPPLGIADFTVEWHNYQTLATEKLASSPAPISTPDIYILMVETLRADALTPVSAPFLLDFQKNHAQPVTRSFSGSNATHLSWFSLFHSCLPVTWRDRMEDLAEDDSYPGSPWLAALQRRGYQLHVRSACDLGYKSIGPVNFGRDYSLVTHLEHSYEGSDISEYRSTKREKLLLESFRDQLPELQIGGNFHFLAFDSAHYNYYWPEDFTPPIAEFDDPVQLPSQPTAEQKRRAWNRYLNAVAWMDELCKRFIDELKATDRFDNSIVIITGDHGEEFQERGGWFHCSSLLPEQTEVPLFIKWPKDYGRGPTVELSSHLDVMPSVFQVLGIEPPGASDISSGQSLLSPSADASTGRATSYTGKRNEALVIENSRYRAAFSWSSPWDSRRPDEISLLSLTGPDGAIDVGKYPVATLEELFPDLNRFFSKLTEK